VVEVFKVGHVALQPARSVGRAPAVPAPVVPAKRKPVAMPAAKPAGKLAVPAAKADDWESF
jgi:hypothetical protein